ncbi:ATP-binding protein [Polaribacter sp. Hel1_85]|uniref:ATP-binding protein n=1 Tax=Polaribacter sp. Hel1_85 TaxID=1250005 RepID=UPI00052C7FF9|nr:ATP-binding protein [Polaribacter sp. Hel1_85]KGL62452.1 two-component system sensor histidine kinase [Polaribacter sp. Hel1_85]
MILFFTFKKILRKNESISIKYNKTLVLLIFLFLSTQGVIAQNPTIKKNIKELKEKVAQTNGAQRLVWMDSLANYITFETSLANDSILRATVDYAKQLDSVNIAVWHTVNILDNINYKNEHLEEGEKIVMQTKPLLPYVTKPKILDKYYFELGELYYLLRDFNESIKSFDSCYSYATKYKTNLVGTSKFRKGITYVDKGDFGKASIEIREASNYFQKGKDTIQWINSKNSMSILYSKNGFYKEAKKERIELIELAKTLQDYPNLPPVYYNIAADDNKAGLQKERISNLKLALEANKISKYKDFYKPILISGLVVAYAENDSIALAETVLKQLKSDEENSSGSNEAYYLEAKKKIAFAKQDYKKAINYGEAYLNLKKESNQYEEIQEAENFLSKAYEAIGERDKAFNHFKNYTKIKDSIGDIQKSRVLAYYQTLYETEKRDLTIQSQENNIALLDSENKLKNQWLLFGGLGLLAVFGFITLYRSRNFVKKKQHLQERFVQDIINTQEKERTRVALELHDSVGQQLMLLTRKSKSLKNKEIETLAKDTLANVRSISQGLHPVVLERLGFTASIEDLVNTIDENSDIFFTLEIENVNEYLDEDKALHLYRIVQEIVNNILKHAEAKAVYVNINKKDNTILLSIKDNGKGFDYQQKIKTSKSLGMKSLLERCKIINSKLKVISAINKGTEVLVLTPANS